MPNTPVYGFRFEDPDEQPGVSLTGGSSGTEDILAEQVETELIRIEGDLNTEVASLAALTSRVDDLENGDSLIGWVPIGAGAVAPGSGPFSIDVTDSGRFPAGTFSAFRLRAFGDLDGVGSIRCRTNGAVSDHLTGAFSISSTGVIGDNTFQSNVSQWFLGFWNLGDNCSVEALIFNTDGIKNCSYTSTGVAQSTTNSLHKISHGFGGLLVARLISSLELRPFSSVSNLWGSFGLNWWLEGFRT